jgi:hypothetical protein
LAIAAPTPQSAMDRHAAAVSAAAAAADEAARRERERREKLEKLNAPPVTAVRKEITIPVYLVGLLLARRPMPKVSHYHTPISPI